MTVRVNGAMRELLAHDSTNVDLPADIRDVIDLGLVKRDQCLLLRAHEAAALRAFRDRTDLEASVNDLTIGGGEGGAAKNAADLAAAGRHVLSKLRGLVAAAGHPLPVRLVLSIDPPFANIRMFSLRADEEPWIAALDALEQPCMFEDVPPDVSPPEPGK